MVLYRIGFLDKSIGTVCCYLELLSNIRTPLFPLSLHTTHTHLLTYSLTYSLTYPLTHSLTHLLTHSH